MILAYLKFAPFYLFSLLPFRIMYRFSELAYLVLCYTVGYRKKVVMQNLRDSFPEKGEEEIRVLARSFYLYFCDVWLETNKLLTISRYNMKRRMTVVNPELIEQYAREKRSVILYSAHAGNWEWMISLPLHLPPQVTAFYKPLSSYGRQ